MEQTNRVAFVIYRCGHLSNSPASISLFWVLVFWLTNKAHYPLAKWPHVSSPHLAFSCFIWCRAGEMWSEISACARWFRCVCTCGRAHVWGVSMIQSAISLCEDSFHKHTRHAEDVVILRLIVCVRDVSSHHQTRGGFTLPLSFSFSAFSSDWTNCPIVLLLLQSHITFISPQKVQLKGAPA